MVGVLGGEVALGAGEGLQVVGHMD